MKPTHKNWQILLTYYYVEFLAKNIPNLIQIIALPSALGILTRLNKFQTNILAIITTILLALFLEMVGSDTFMQYYETIQKKTGVGKTNAYRLWNILNFSFGVFGGLIVSLIISFSN